MNLRRVNIKDNKRASCYSSWLIVQKTFLIKKNHLTCDHTTGEVLTTISNDHNCKHPTNKVKQEKEVSHPQSNGKLEVSNKYLKPTLKKLCERDPANWDKYLNQVLASYRITPNLMMTESPFFLVYGRDPNLPLYQLLEPMQ